MTDEKPDTPNSQNTLSKGLPIGLPIGIGVGVALGVALDNIAVGIALGVGIGLSFSVAIGGARLAKAKKKSENADDASSGEGE